MNEALILTIDFLRGRGVSHDVGIILGRVVT